MPIAHDDINAMTARLYALGAAILAKTGDGPWFGPKIAVSDGRCEITLYGGDIGTPALFHAKGDTPCAALAAADAFVAAMPDLAITQLHGHMKRLAACIDKGRAVGIDEAYLAPLAVTVKAISANLLPPPNALTAAEELAIGIRSAAE